MPQSADHFLGVITPAEAEQLLMDLANIPDWPPVGTVIIPGETDRYRTWPEGMQKRYPRTFGNCSVADMHALKRLLLAAWEGSDLRRREWFCFLARKLHADIERHAQTDRDKLVRDARTQKHELEILLEEKTGRPQAEMIYNLRDHELIVAINDESELPALGQFESTIFYLQRNLNHALRCLNPTCAMPYFFAHKKGVRYCSPTCAQWGQRESKQRWWSSPEGKAWQENRSKSKKKKKRRKQ